jgi:hypothetical protein
MLIHAIDKDLLALAQARDPADPLKSRYLVCNSRIRRQQRPLRTYSDVSRVKVTFKYLQQRAASPFTGMEVWGYMQT